MGHLARWSSRGVLTLWLAWLGLLLSLFVLDVRRQWQSQAPIVASPETTSVAAELGTRLKVPPEQHTDLVYSVVLDPQALLKTVLVLVGPPGILTAVWLYARKRS